MRRTERLVEQLPHVAPPEPGMATPGPVAGVLALQRGAGNAAVSAMLSRRRLARAPTGTATPPAAAPPDPRAVSVTASDPASADAMTLSAFDEFTRKQADWASQAPFAADPAATAELRDVVVLGQENGGDLLSAAGRMKMSELRPAVKTDAGKLRAYGRAVKSAGWTPATTVADAVAWGEAADKLTSALGEQAFKDTVKQGPLGRNVADLIAAGAVDDYADFVRSTSPLLSARDGAEVRSFLSLRAEGGWKPYVGNVGPVRNLHHFAKAALEGLQKNAADTSRAKPLAVVMHSTIDHNGAFHRDPNMSQVVTAPQSNTIIIEGSGTLDAAGGSLNTVVAAYGQGTPPKARQIMLAGHGNSRVTELAGDRGPDGAIKAENVDLDKNNAESMKLIQTMLANLDSDPKARIVLNGCLTASTGASGPLPRGAGAADRQKAHDDLAAELQKNRSLADTIRDEAAKQGIKPGQVSASNSSFGEEAALIDPKTGDLGLRSPDDPQMTNADKFAYLEDAGEAGGAGRALVECAVADPVKAKASAQKRLTHSKARMPWDDTVIKALLREALVDLGDLAFINLAAALAGGVSEIQFLDMARVGLIASAPADVLDRLLGRLEKDPQFTREGAHLRLVAYEVWMASNATKAPAFVSHLAGFTAQDAKDMVSLKWMKAKGLYGTLLPGADGPGELRLALLEVVGNGAAADPAAVEFLRKRRTGSAFTDPNEISLALGGRSSAAAVLELIKEPSGSASSPEPNYNLDLDGDGKNDTFVEPMSKRGVTAVADIEVRAKPDPAAAVLGKLGGSVNVNVIGKSGEWTAIEFGAAKKPGFAKQILIFG